jgi:hypothetical protein
VAGARAEARWLAGESEAIAAETDAALALEQTTAGPAASCTCGAGAPARRRLRRDAVAEPFRLELAGDWAAAAERWTAMGCPYEAALALGHADDDDAPAARLAELQRLGAHRPPRRIARALRERGARDVSRGPRPRRARTPPG